MKKLLSLGMIGVVVFISCLLLSSQVVAQSAQKKQRVEKRKQGKKLNTKTVYDQEFAQDFWTWLKKIEYRETFSPWPGKSGEFYPGQSPHGEFLKLYVNRKTVLSTDDPTFGSIIVKENFNEDKELGAITIMYRARKGYDPEYKDWWWVKYLPSGKVAQTDQGEPIVGKVKSCIECHAAAGGDDYIFTNDD